MSKGILGLARHIYGTPRPDDLRQMLLDALLAARHDKTKHLSMALGEAMDNGTSDLDAYMALCLTAEAVRWAMMKDQDAEGRFTIGLLLTGIRESITDAAIGTAEMVARREAEIGADAVRAEAKAALDQFRRTRGLCWSDTAEAAAFIATADSRETSPEIMRAIAFYARNEAEAVEIWEEGHGGVCGPLDIWRLVTNDGERPTTDYHWGASGTRWWDA